MGLIHKKDGGDLKVDLTSLVKLTGNIGMREDSLVIGAVELINISGNKKIEFFCTQCGNTFEIDEVSIRCEHCGEIFEISEGHKIRNSGGIYCSKCAKSLEPDKDCRFLITDIIKSLI